MTPAELSEKLWDNAERVAKYLLPKGHLEGKEWCVGNTNGDAGKSLKINIGGKKTWADFASGDSGDLLDLWVLVRNCQLHDAMREAKEFLGLKDDDHHFEAKKKTFSRPTKKGVKKASNCYDYLATRGITRETADLFAKLRDADVAARTGKWLADQRNAQRVAAEVSTVLRERAPRPLATGWATAFRCTACSAMTPAPPRAAPS